MRLQSSEYIWARTLEQCCGWSGFGPDPGPTSKKIPDPYINPFSNMDIPVVCSIFIIKMNAVSKLVKNGFVYACTGQLSIIKAGSICGSRSADENLGSGFATLLLLKNIGYC
jgi:hypothetical protein